MVLFPYSSCLLFFVAIFSKYTAIQAQEAGEAVLSNSDRVDQQCNDDLRSVKLELWSRGVFDFDHLAETTVGSDDWFRKGKNNVMFRNYREKESLFISSGRNVRKEVLADCLRGDCGSGSVIRDEDTSDPGWMLNRFRGGSTSAPENFEAQRQQKIEQLGKELGPSFLEAIDLNQKEHAEDCKKSCEIFYCGEQGNDIVHENANNTSIKSYSMGATPPEDFAEQFNFPLDLIKVTEGAPLFSASEAANVIKDALADGIEGNEYKSGKYKLGGDWLDNLPNVRAWFNLRLKDTFFPIFASMFPEIISSQSVLRAHSVSLLKYNSSHPRTDVHVDNGVLALTVAMSPMTDYVGGGTYFEHMGVDNVIEMDVGHATFRPGSVRHGGHRVTSGDRYILGCFLLLEDRVEHVRRLKSRGTALRRKGDNTGAIQNFQWALALNPKCTTCYKDMAEVLHAQGKYVEAENNIRLALELLENKDSDALFTLGVLLSEQGKDDEAIEAYQKSVTLNAEDAEVCFNLGVKFAAKGDVEKEMEMYSKAVKADSKFGPAWLNWGTALAERGNVDDAETMFLKGVECGGDAAPKAMMNLGLVYNVKGNKFAQQGDMTSALRSAMTATQYTEQAKPFLDEWAKSGKKLAEDSLRYIEEYVPQRLQCYRFLGQVYAGTGDMLAAEQEFRKATEAYPNELPAWQMLGRVLEMQGKTEEFATAKQMIEQLASKQK